MDRSFLSDPEVVAASRDFICVRLATYESEEEMEFMDSIYFFRTPTKNSVFAILDPSAKKHLVKPGRSMKLTFDGATEMATEMKKITATFPGKGNVAPEKLGLPYLKDVRLALNVAACDSQCLVILYASSERERRGLEALLLPLAWHADLVGEFLYATTDKLTDLKKITGSGTAPGLLVVMPDTYGLAGRQVAFVALGTKSKNARATLAAAAEANRMGSKDSKRHIGRGRREGIEWEVGQAQASERPSKSDGD
jgi:hypothetical protein